MKITKEDQNLMIVGGLSLVKLFSNVLLICVGLFIIFKFENLEINQIPINIYLGLFFIIMALIKIIKNKTTTITIDKIAKKIYINWKSAISKENKELEIDSIKEIKLKQIHQQENTDSKKSRPIYDLVFTLNNGEEINLTPSGPSSFNILGMQINPDEKIGEKIANYLNIPFIKPPTIMEAMSNMTANIKEAMSKDTEAEKLATIKEMTERGITNKI